MTPTNPTPSAAAVASAQELLNCGYLYMTNEGAAIIDKHYAAQRDAIEKAIEALEEITGPISGLARYCIATTALREVRGGK